MKLYIFQCGTIRTKKHLLIAGCDAGIDYEVPVPFFLIEHPLGNVLFDVGEARSAIKSDTSGNYIPIMTEEDYVVSQLAKVGMQTSDISHIVLSHLHSDHAGGIDAFNGTRCYARKAEVETGDNNRIVEKHLLDWRLLDGEREAFCDMFGDNAVTLFFTPGHTPGHQSLLLNLNGFRILLAADSVYTEEILDGSLPGLYYDLDDTVRTIEMIKRMRNDGVEIITGHDPLTWEKFRLAPDYYE